MACKQNREALLQRVAELETELRRRGAPRAPDGPTKPIDFNDFENAADGMCICHAIDDFPFVRFTFWNQRMVDLSGYSREEINRKGWYQSVYPDPVVRARAVARMEQMRQGRNLQAETWEITRADGGKRTLRISTSLLDPHGIQPRVLAIMHDITDLRLTAERLQQRQRALETQMRQESQRRTGAEDALRRTESRYRTFFRVANDALFIENELDEIVDVNRQACELLGYRREELLAMKVPQIQAPECRGLAGTVLAEEIAAHHGRPFESVDLHKNGERIPVEVTNAPLDDSGLVLSIVRDIRERKTAQKALQDSERLLSDVIETMQEGVFVVDRDYRLTLWNRSMEKISATSRQTVLGSIAWQWVAFIKGDIQGAIEKAMGGKSALAMERQVALPGGKTGWVREKLLPFFDSQGAVRGVLGVIADITATKAAEQRLTQNLQFTRTLLNAIPTPAFFKDRQGRYQGCNTAFTELMGVTAEAIKGKTVHDLWPGEQAEMYHRKDLELMQSPRHQIYEFEIRDRHGNIRPVIFAKDVFRDEKGAVAGIVGAFLDVSEQKRMKAQLEHREERLRTLV